MISQIKMEHITKQFGPLTANDDVTITFKKGQIHSLLGENGAGKSTLMSILFGIYSQEKGKIYVDNEEVSIKSPLDAAKYHIGMVHQHFKLVEDFTVLENITLGIEDVKRFNFIDYKRAREKLEEVMNQYNIHVDLDKKISQLNVGNQQKVEILKMLYRESDVLIFDEPTAVLIPQEIEELMKTLKFFASKGKIVILITHKLNEIKLVSDVVSVLKRGKLVKTVDAHVTSIEDMAEMMVGRKISFSVDKPPLNKGKVLLEVNNLSLSEKGISQIKNINFKLHEGEIIGIAGVAANGQTELIYALAGLVKESAGSISFHRYENNKEEVISIHDKTIRQRNEVALAHVPEDRHKHGIVKDFSVADNLVIKSYYQTPYQNHFFLDFGEITRHADQLTKDFDIRTSAGIRTKAGSLSGGNQQKAIFAREISTPHSVLLSVQPTRGLDVGAIENIHKYLIQERAQKKGVILVSYELDEIVDLSDRILVMYNGEIVADLDNSTPVELSKLGFYMAGGKK
jgi:simple sugar transport system ATP-binding protein